jgi:hypothetical protein
MQFMTRLILFYALLLSTAQTFAAKGDDAVVEVVRKFYAWYVPATPQGKWRSCDAVLKERSSLMTSELSRALKEDFEAQSREKDEIVGLDFDPFLATQDPCERYEVGKATGKGKGYSVEVYAVCEGKRRDKPDVIAELVPKDGTWVFANFRYPREQNDLLRVLKELRQERHKRQPNG